MYSSASAINIIDKMTDIVVQIEEQKTKTLELRTQVFGKLDTLETKGKADLGKTAAKATEQVEGMIKRGTDEAEKVGGMLEEKKNRMEAIVSKLRDIHARLTGAQPNVRSDPELTKLRSELDSVKQLSAQLISNFQQEAARLMNEFQTEDQNQKALCEKTVQEAMNSLQQAGSTLDSYGS